VANVGKTLAQTEHSSRRKQSASSRRARALRAADTKNMIRPLRQRHRLIISTLAVLLPLAFVLGLSARKTSPTMRETPPALRPEPFSLPRVLFEKEDLWSGMKITTRVCAEALPATRLVLELQPQEDLHSPDILVYWSPQISGSAHELLKEAHLLGTLAGRQKHSWLLSGTMVQAEGTLILYSLGHQTVLASALLKIPQGGQQQ